MTDTTNMRVLVVGGSGMLGHKVCETLRDRFETWATVRSRSALPPSLLDKGAVLADVRADAFDSVVGAVEACRPAVIVNCVGVVKQLKAASDPIPSIAINALFPHRLAALAHAAGARLIHISTDCVFAGTRGRYTEADVADATDLYGRTKWLGEVTGPGCLTLRTSIIGRELSGATGLTEWFLSNRGRSVKGYTQARFSGLTTIALSAVIAEVISRHRDLEGLYHVASDPISKYDLLHRLNAAFGAGAAIEPSDDVRIDRSLDGSRFRAATGLSIPGWDAMIAGMVADPAPYEEWRQHRV